MLFSCSFVFSCRNVTVLECLSFCFTPHGLGMSQYLHSFCERNKATFSPVMLTILRDLRKAAKNTLVLLTFRTVAIFVLTLWTHKYICLQFGDKEPWMLRYIFPIIWTTLEVNLCINDKSIKGWIQSVSYAVKCKGHFWADLQRLPMTLPFKVKLSYNADLLRYWLNPALSLVNSQLF